MFPNQFKHTIFIGTRKHGKMNYQFIAEGVKVGFKRGVRSLNLQNTLGMYISTHFPTKYIFISVSNCFNIIS